MQSVEYIAKTIVTPRDAIASLVRWKITLLMATQMRERLSPRATQSIENPQECSIGLWLVSSHTLHLRGTSEYRAVLHLHFEFHREMQKIARLINSEDYASAERLLNEPIGIQTVSVAVANAIMALERIPAAKLAT